MGFVGRNEVFSIEYCKTNKHRFFLRLVVNQNPQNRVVVVMKNPSATCINCPNGHNLIVRFSDKAKCKIDRTTGKVLRKLQQSYDEIIILNLYSLYDKNPQGINSYYGKIKRTGYHLNNACLRMVLDSYSGEIICAWGQPNGINIKQYNSQINFINSLFNRNHKLLEYGPGHRNFTIKQSNYPPHGLTWI